MMLQKEIHKPMGLNYTIQYKKGLENKVVDALSEKKSQSESESLDTLSALTSSVPSWMEEVPKSYLNDD